MGNVRLVGMRKAVVAALLGAALTVVVLGASGPASGRQLPRAKCAGSSKALEAKGGRFNVGYRLRCNFKVLTLTLKSSKRVTRVMARPKLDPGTGGAVSCKRIKKRRVRCEGEVREDTQIVGSLRVKGGPCEKPRLRVEATISGGLDCPAEPCPSIGYKVTVSMPAPAGC